jgi:hypothetical protein
VRVSRRYRGCSFASPGPLRHTQLVPCPLAWVTRRRDLVTPSVLQPVDLSPLPCRQVLGWGRRRGPRQEGHGYPISSDSSRLKRWPNTDRRG